MSKGSKERRGRSRKRRPVAADGVPSKRREPRVATPPPTTSTTLGERPRAPWHPLPLSEIVILAGAVGTVIALRRHSHGGPLLIASLIAAGLGTVEVTVREHWGGYRSHAILLSLAAALAFHSAVVLGATAVANPKQLLNLVLLPIDFALFVFVFRVLRARFLQARQRRAVSGG